MKNLKIIGKVATFFGIASVVFAVLLAILAYYLLGIASPGAPTSYVVCYILLNMLPYLFFAVLSLVIAVISRRVGKDVTNEIEPDPVPEEQTEENTG
jgi:membrane protein implicated in regulation of membrane protease activity